MNDVHKKPRNKSKAEVRFEPCEGKTVAVKDYGMRSFLLRLYGRFTLKNEARAYNRLAGIHGIPACYGLRGSDILEYEYIPSRPLSSFKPGAVPAPVFEKLEQIIVAMHSRGVANGDLHRSNVLLTDVWDVYLIDFAHACVARTPDHPGALIRLLMQLDRHAFARIRARYLRLPPPVPKGVFGLLYTAGALFKSGIKRLKKF